MDRQALLSVAKCCNADGRTDGQTDKQTGRQAGRQTDSVL